MRARKRMCLFASRCVGGAWALCARLSATRAHHEDNGLWPVRACAVCQSRVKGLGKWCMHFCLERDSARPQSVLVMSPSALGLVLDRTQHVSPQFDADPTFTRSTTAMFMTSRYAGDMLALSMSPRVRARSGLQPSWQPPPHAGCSTGGSNLQDLQTFMALRSSHILVQLAASMYMRTCACACACGMCMLCMCMRMRMCMYVHVPCRRPT